MPRVKKPHLKQRPDGRFRCRYKNLDFYGFTEDEALDARAAYIAAEKTGDVFRSSVTVFEYASAWLPRSHPSVSESTYRGLAIHLEKLTKRIIDIDVSEVFRIHPERTMDGPGKIHHPDQKITVSQHRTPPTL